MTQHQIAKHSDESDIASEIEAAFLEKAINDVRAKVKRSQEPNSRGSYLILECIECGGGIGQGRLEVSIKNTLCIECATALEKRR